MRECMLCKRDMKKSNDLFGSGCINFIYNSLELDVKRKNKEEYLCKYIMKQTNTKTLDKQMREWLIDRYLTLHFLENMKYGDFNKIKENINKDIAMINGINHNKKICSINDITLKEAYYIYKSQVKYENQIKKLSDSIGSKIDEIKIKAIILGFSYIFNLKLNEKQYKSSVFKEMQFRFWQEIIEGGKILNDYNISAEFLQHSLSENPENLFIKDGRIVNAIKEDRGFKKIINKTVRNHINDRVFNEKINKGISFENGDLFYSLHKASLSIAGLKVNNKWIIDVYMHDTFDFTEFKDINDYYNSSNNIIKSMFSSTLYDFAYYSVKFKVIKEYDIDIDFRLNDY